MILQESDICLLCVPLKLYRKLAPVPSLEIREFCEWRDTWLASDLQGEKELLFSSFEVRFCLEEASKQNSIPSLANKWSSPWL
jgi:hypothetical protein